jgi:hypothetical protein
MTGTTTAQTTAASRPAGSWAAVLGLAAALVGSGTMPAQAGLLELIFGGGQLRPRAEVPLEMTITPARPAPSTYGTGDEIIHVRSIPIDPVKQPNWYLTDPTLRPGDIVVLPQKVLVYSGARGERRLADFADLDRARKLSRRDRDRIRQMTEQNQGPALHYTVIPAPEQQAITSADEVQPARAPGPPRPIRIGTAADVNG